MRLPNFLVIGAQKSGTTWMHEVFARHPEIFVPEKKELEFFSYTGKMGREGLQAYSENFSAVTSEKAIGEKTPSYFWNSGAYPEWDSRKPGFQREIPRVVKECLGADVRLILSMREPVARAISGFMHHVRWGNVTATDGILEAGKQHGIVHMGFYYEHLTCWLEYFDLEKMKILIFEEIMADQAAASREIFRYLGVDEDNDTAVVTDVVHGGLQRSVRGGQVYLPKPGLKVEQLDTAPLSKLQLVASREDLRRLADLYAPDVEKLEGLLGRSIDVWRMGQSSLLSS